MLAAFEAGRLSEAESLARLRLRDNADDAEAQHVLGLLALRAGRLEEARVRLEGAVAAQPENALFRGNLGLALKQAGLRAAAVEQFEQALVRAPTFAAAWNNLGNTLSEMGRLVEAEAAFGELVRRAPSTPTWHLNHARTLTLLGRAAEAVEAGRRALRLQPENAVAHSNLLLDLHYLDDVSADAIFAEHRRWAERFAPAVPPAPVADPDPARKLRIGYVSADLYAHAVANFLAPVLGRHDRANYSVFVYANLKHEDQATARLRQEADGWCAIREMDDEEAAAQVRADRIDILVDLSGHMAGNRLLLFARKPAPIQATWLGYPDTTGLDAIDYRLSDAVADPPGEADRFCSETLVRLASGFHCYHPPDDAPMPAVRPADASVAFGSFNNYAKVSPACLRLWGRLLEVVPEARLVLKAKSLGDEQTRETVRRRFADIGVNPSRLRVLPPVTTRREHLAAYGEVDIALDTYPYHGTTTTFEALWMGVPVVTLLGSTHAARVGASILTHAGLTEWIATSPEKYVELAASRARDVGALRARRPQLRGRISATPLLDAEGFAGKLEEVYRRWWRRRCAEVR